MNNVEKRIGENFASWRTEKKKMDNSADAIDNDIKEYMLATFQIDPKEDTNILDILDTMIAPDVEASVAANSVRENVLACKEDEENIHPQESQVGAGGGIRDKREAASVLSCSNPSFTLSGTSCFFWKSDLVDQANATAACAGLKMTI